MNTSAFHLNIPIRRSFEALQSISSPGEKHISWSNSSGNAFTIFLLSIGFFAAWLAWLSSSTTPVVKGPVAGHRSVFEPTFLLRLRFIFYGAKIMQEGFNKFKDRCYIVKRMDSDVTVIPPKYFDELRKSALDELSSTHANIHNMCGTYTDLNEILVNDLFRTVITHHLNPNLAGFTSCVQDELEYSFQVDMPDFPDYKWKSIDIHTLIRRNIGRIVTRITLGLPHCRNMDMVSIMESHTLSIFAMTAVLRKFPPFMHPFIAPLLPPRWQIRRNIQIAEKVAQPIFDEHFAQQGQVKASQAQPSTEPQTLLGWMVDNATPEQKTLRKLVLILLAVTIAAVYTSSQVTSVALIFLAANPQYIEELRKEVTDHTDDIAKIDPNKLVKVDAVLAETLRLHPPLINAPQRRALQDIRLRDGVIIPKGALIAFPCLALASDPLTYPEPERFQPFRAENFSPGIATPTKKKLAFGWGTQACPGRFLAAKEMKLVIARLLMEYDVSLAPDSDEMRRELDIEDLRVLKPNFRILMRRRIPA